MTRRPSAVVFTAGASFFPEVVVSALVLLPCFWQSRIQAGDLASHIYNAWLALEIEQGGVEGLFLATQWTNVLFDYWLTWLLRLCGAVVAQRIAVGAAVLIFFWGAFALVSRVNGQRPWQLAPCLAMLAYGWVFHAGLFNFYVSLGLCLWALALLWAATPARACCATLLLVLAVLAHALPAAWAVGAACYRLWAERCSLPGRSFLLVVASASVTALFWILGSGDRRSGIAYRCLLMLGLDQLWVHGPRYLWLSVGLLLLWTLWLARLLARKGACGLLASVQVHWLVLTSLGILLAPSALFVPGYNSGLTYIAERMSLAAAAMVCVILGAARLPRWIGLGPVVLAAIYFGYLWEDVSRLNALEDRIEAAVMRLPPRQRVISVFCGSESRVWWSEIHLVDRVCLGRCYSYANYEPSTGQFRVRALPTSAAVLPDAAAVVQVVGGNYRVRERDVPLFLVHPCGTSGSGFCVHELAVGEVAATACGGDAQ